RTEDRATSGTSGIRFWRPPRPSGVAGVRGRPPGRVRQREHVAVAAATRQSQSDDDLLIWRADAERAHDHGGIARAVHQQSFAVAPDRLPPASPAHRLPPDQPGRPPPPRTTPPARQPRPPPPAGPAPPP